MSNFRPLDTGFYVPTDNFKSIPEHIAVMFKDDLTLVAVLGASDDDPENLSETRKYANLFMLSPELLAALKPLLVRSENMATLLREQGYGLHDAHDLKPFKDAHALIERLEG